MIVIFSNKEKEWGVGCDKVKINTQNQTITMINQYGEITEDLNYVEEIID